MTGTDTGPAYSRVASALRRLILDGELIPEERLPEEADLAGHHLIAEAIEGGDADRAGKEVTEHVAHLHATYTKIDRRAGRSQ